MTDMPLAPFRAASRAPFRAPLRADAAADRAAAPITLASADPFAPAIAALADDAAAPDAAAADPAPAAAASPAHADADASVAAATSSALVPVRRPRADGWTAERQRAFILALADTGSVGRAAAAVGMSRESAYRLRRRAGAIDFVVAWDAARDAAVQRLADTCLERAIHGDELPVFHKGEIVGTRRRYPDALAIFLLRMRDPLRHGPLADRIDQRNRLRVRWKWFDHVRRGLANLPAALAVLRALPPAPEEDEIGAGAGEAPPARDA